VPAVFPLLSGVLKSPLGTEYIIAEYPGSEI